MGSIVCVTNYSDSLLLFFSVIFPVLLSLHCCRIQGASGIDARFLKLSPALTVSPIMTKFSQYNPYYLELVSICRQD
jgi:hypothetical protein